MPNFWHYEDSNEYKKRASKYAQERLRQAAQPVAPSTTLRPVTAPEEQGRLIEQGDPYSPFKNREGKVTVPSLAWGLLRAPQEYIGAPLLGAISAGIKKGGQIQTEGQGPADIYRQWRRYEHERPELWSAQLGPLNLGEKFFSENFLADPLFWLSWGTTAFGKMTAKALQSAKAAQVAGDLELATRLVNKAQTFGKMAQGFQVADVATSPLAWPGLAGRTLTQSALLGGAIRAGGEGAEALAKEVPGAVGWAGKMLAQAPQGVQTGAEVVGRAGQLGGWSMNLMNRAATLPLQVGEAAAYKALGWSKDTIAQALMKNFGLAKGSDLLQGLYADRLQAAMPQVREKAQQLATGETGAVRLGGWKPDLNEPVEHQALTQILRDYGEDAETPTLDAYQRIADQLDKEINQAMTDYTPEGLQGKLAGLRGGVKEQALLFGEYRDVVRGKMSAADAEAAWRSMKSNVKDSILASVGDLLEQAGYTPDEVKGLSIGKRRRLLGELAYGAEMNAESIKGVSKARRKLIMQTAREDVRAVGTMVARDVLGIPGIELPQKMLLRQIIGREGLGEEDWAKVSASDIKAALTRIQPYVPVGAREQPIPFTEAEIADHVRLNAIAPGGEPPTGEVAPEVAPGVPETGRVAPYEIEELRGKLPVSPRVYEALRTAHAQIAREQSGRMLNNSTLESYLGAINNILEATGQANAERMGPTLKDIISRAHENLGKAYAALDANDQGGVLQWGEMALSTIHRGYASPEGLAPAEQAAPGEEPAAAVSATIDAGAPPPIEPPKLSAGATTGEPLTPEQQAFWVRFEDLHKTVSAAEKTPNRVMTRAETVLMEQDWKAYARSRGYTETEIADHERLNTMMDEGQRLGFSIADLNSLDLPTTGAIAPVELGPKITAISQLTVGDRVTLDDGKTGVVESVGGGRARIRSTLSNGVEYVGNYTDAVLKLHPLRLASKGTTVPAKIAPPAVVPVAIVSVEPPKPSTGGLSITPRAEIEGGGIVTQPGLGGAGEPPQPPPPTLPSVVAEPPPGPSEALTPPAKLPRATYNTAFGFGVAAREDGVAIYRKNAAGKRTDVAIFTKAELAGNDVAKAQAIKAKLPGEPPAVVNALLKNIKTMLGRMVPALPPGVPAPVGRHIYPEKMSMDQGLAQIDKVTRKSPARTALKLRDIWREIGTTMAPSVAGQIDQYGDVWKNFEVDKDQRALIGGQRVAVLDVFENPSQFPLNEVQKKQTKFIGELGRDARRVADEENIKFADITQLNPGDPTQILPPEQFMTRRTLGRMDPDTGLWEVVQQYPDGKIRPVVPASFQRERVFETHEEAIQAGFKDMKPTEAWTAYTTQLYRKAGDNKLAEYWLSQVPPLHEGEAVHPSVDVLFPIPGAGNKGWDQNNPNVQILKKGLGMSGVNESKIVAKWVAKASEWPRLLLTNFDNSAPFMQGQVLLFYKPGVWVQAVEQGIETFRRTAEVSGQKWNEFLADPQHAETVRLMANYGMQLGAVDVNRKVQESGYVEGEGLMKKLSWRFGPAYQRMLDAGRILAAESLLPKATNDAERLGLMTAVDHMLGTVSWARTPVGETAQAWGGATLFSVRYTLGTIAHIMDIGKKGLQGDIARESLGKWAIGGLLTYTALCALLKQKPNFDPRSGGKWLSVRIGNVNVGIGGAFYSILRALGQIVMKPEEAPKTLLNWVVGRGAPITSTAYKLITHQDYIGRKLDTLPKMVADIAKTNFIPAWLQDVVAQEGSFAEKFTLAAAGAGGLRSYPVSPANKRDELRNDLSQQSYGKPYAELDRTQRYVIDQNEDVQVQVQEARKAGLEKGDVVTQFWTDVEQERGTYEQELAQKNQALSQGLISGNDYRDSVQQIEYMMAAIPRNLKATDRYAEVPLSDAERTAYYGGKAPVENAVDVFIDSYYQIPQQLTDPRTGEADPAEIVRLREQLEKNTDPAVVAQAKAYINRNRNPLYVQAMEEYKQYQAIPQYLGLSREQQNLANTAARQFRALRRMYPTEPTAMTQQRLYRMNPEWWRTMMMSRGRDNPQRRRFWSQHPLLTAFFSDLEGEPLEQIMTSQSATLPTGGWSASLMQQPAAY